MKKPSSTSGFTLIELMIVIAIIGVLAMIGLPSLRNSYNNSMVKTTVSDVHIDMLLARSEAIKRNASVDVAPITGGWQIQLVSDGTILKTRNDTPDPITVECNINTSAAAEACPNPYVRYTRTGRVSSFIEVRFYIGNNPNVAMRCLSTTLSGRPYIEVDTDGTTSDGCD